MALAVYRSTIGKKAVMAVTGVLLFGFVVLHMLGNLKIFTGAEHFNEYAESLRTLGAPLLGRGQLLWILRAALTLAVVLHILAAYQLTRLNNAARPVSYAKKTRVRSSYAALTMRWGGVVIALFVVYHLLHFTTGDVHPEFVHGDVYSNVVSGFEVWYVAAFYILAMTALGLHLYHGLWSMFQTLGRGSGPYRDLIRAGAAGAALLVVIGNVSVPIAVLAGIVE